MFPCFDQPNIKADFTILVVVPVDWIAFTSAQEKCEPIKMGSVYFDETFRRFNVNKQDVLLFYSGGDDS